MSVLFNGTRNTDGQSHDKDDNQDDQANQEITSDLAPHAQNYPDYDSNEENAQRYVRDIGPLGTIHEQADCIANNVVVEKSANQRAMVNGQENL